MPEWAWQAPSRQSASTCGLHGRARDQLALDDPDLVGDQALDRPLYVEHLEFDVGPDDGAGVAVLAAGLGVERGAVEHDRDDVALAGVGRRAVGAEDAADRRLAGQLLVAAELGAADLVEQRPVGRHVDVAALVGGGVGLRLAPLLGHQRPEPGLVDGQALLARHLQGEVDREAVGVVQGERLLAGQRPRAGLPVARDGPVEDRGAGPQGVPEGLLLAFGVPHDPVEVGRRARGTTDPSRRGPPRPAAASPAAHTRAAARCG